MSKLKTGGDAAEKNIHISTGTILKTVAVVLAVVFLYFIREIVVILILALLLAALIDPFAHYLERFKIGRGVSVIIVYLVLIGMVVGLFFLVAPALRDQTAQFVEHYEPYITEIAGRNEVLAAFLRGDFFSLDINEIFRVLRGSGLGESIPQVVTAVTNAFGAIISGILVFVLAFYLVVQEETLKRGLSLVTPEKYRAFTNRILPKARQKTGDWLRGQLIVMFVIFVVMYILLEFVLNIPFALLFALLAGLLEIVPFIGPILSAVPAVIIAFTISPAMGFLTMLAYFGVQQFEGQVLTPKVMQKTTGINPVFSILAVLIGYELVGIAGAILAIPMAVVIGVTYFEWLVYKGTIPPNYER